MSNLRKKNKIKKKVLRVNEVKLPTIFNEKKYASFIWFL